jgi:hypothetical protein
MKQWTMADVVIVSAMLALIIAAMVIVGKP